MTIVDHIQEQPVTLTRADLIASEEAIANALRHLTRLIEYRASADSVLSATDHLRNLVHEWTCVKAQIFGGVA